MAVGDFFGTLKNKAHAAYVRFFYDGAEAPSPRVQDDDANQQGQAFAGQQQIPMQDPAQYAQAQSAYQQGYQQQIYGQSAFQQPPSGAYQPVDYRPNAQSQPQVQSVRQPRSRRNQQGENVVYFSSFQQPQPAQGQAPQAAEQPAQEGENQQALLTARIINARSMGDCRSAITLLRNGEAVVIVMENVNDPTEMRRLVDTLSGACYSLTATITKVSRYGVYLLAPQTLAVYADQATNMMNSAPARAQRPAYQPAYGGQRVSYAQPQPQQRPAQSAAQQNAAPNPYAGMPGFTQRSAGAEETQQNFYQRPMPQAASTQGFSAQPVSYGYAPDESAAVDQ